MPFSPLDIDEALRCENDHDAGDHGRGKMGVRIAAVADLPSRFGQFQIVAFSNHHDDKEHIALVHGDVRGHERVPVRVHSECLTGDVLGSLRCDCRDQLVEALKVLGQMERGVLLYLRQEGRGIGLINKIRAYRLQDDGLDTVEANLALGFQDEERDFAIAAHMLHCLNIVSIQLMTNNPYKINELKKHGVLISQRLQHELPHNRHNKSYLATKSAKMGHFLEMLPDVADVEPSCAIK